MLTTSHYYSDVSDRRTSVSPFPGVLGYGEEARGSVLTPDTSAASSSSANGSDARHDFYYDDSPIGGEPALLHPFSANYGTPYHHAYYSNTEIDAGNVSARHSRHRSVSRRPATPSTSFAGSNKNLSQYNFYNCSPMLRRCSPSIIRLNDRKHFHYDSVEIGPITIQLVSTNAENSKNSKINSISHDGDNNGDNINYILSQKWTFSVGNNDNKWMIRRSTRELVEFDRQLHRCVFERQHSRLVELAAVLPPSRNIGGDSMFISASASSTSTSEFASITDMMPSPSQPLPYIIDVVRAYLDRLSQLTGSLMICYPVLKFLELDSHGNHFVPIENSSINMPAIAVAVVVRDFYANNPDQLSLRAGDIVSVVEMGAETEDGPCYWRGKLTVPRALDTSQKRRKSDHRRKPAASFEVLVPSADERACQRAAEIDGYTSTRRPFQVGSFPRECVRIFTGKLDFDVPSSLENGNLVKRRSPKLTSSLKQSTNLPTLSAASLAQQSPTTVLIGSIRSCYGMKTRFRRWQSEKRRPLIKSLMNIFLDSTDTPSRNNENQPTGRVFGVDLQAHLRDSEREVPLVLTSCINVIENHGIVTGIYRQCGIQSNIRRLRWEFDNGLQPNLLERGILCDIHCVASLLKQYFRQLPNPLFTYELYDDLLRAYGRLGDDSPLDADDGRRISRRTVQRICALQNVVRRLPAPHLRTAICLLNHLSQISKFKDITDMTASNLAIVWAPNLLRSPPQNDAASDDAHLLLGLDVNKSLCTFLIAHAASIFGPRVQFDTPTATENNWRTLAGWRASDYSVSPIAVEERATLDDTASVDDNIGVALKFITLRHIDSGYDTNPKDNMQKSAEMFNIPAKSSSGSTKTVNEKSTIPWRGRALFEFGRSVRNSMIQPLQIATRRRRHVTVVTTPRDEIIVTSSLSELSRQNTLPQPPHNMDVSLRHNDAVVNNESKRNRMMKHNSVSPSLMRRPLLSSLYDQTTHETIKVGQNLSNGSVCHSINLGLHKARRHNSQKSVRGEYNSSAKHRTSLMISSNFDNVDENVKLGTPPNIQRKSVNPSVVVESLCDGTQSTKIENFRRHRLGDSKMENTHDLNNNKPKKQNNVSLHTSEAINLTVAESPKDRQIKTTSTEVSSSESLPLDVSRYDNVTVPTDKMQNVSILRLQSRARRARRPRPTSTPLACMDTQLLPLPEQSSKLQSPSLITNPLPPAANSIMHATGFSHNTSYLTFNRTMNNLYYF